MPETRSFTHLGDIRLATAGPLRILQAWSRVVGSPLADRARPCEWRDGVLTLSVDEPRWRTTLEALGPVLREEINAWLGGDLVREIRVQGRGPAEE